MLASTARLASLVVGHNLVWQLHVVDFTLAVVLADVPRCWTQSCIHGNLHVVGYTLAVVQSHTAWCVEPLPLST